MTCATWLEGDEDMSGSVHGRDPPAEDARIVVQFVDGDQLEVLEEPADIHEHNALSK